MSLRATMVLTPIANPVVLEGYRENFAAHSHLEQVQVIVIPDRKTPSTVFLRCAELRKKGLDVLCPSLEEQERFHGFIWTESTRDYFYAMAEFMRAWVAACRQLAAV